MSSVFSGCWCPGDPLWSGASRGPMDTVPHVLGEGQATFEVRGEQDPCGHGPACPRRRAGDLSGQGQAGAPWTRPCVSWEKGRRPLRSGVNRIPVDMAPCVQGEGQGPQWSRASRIPVDMAPRVRGEGQGPLRSRASRIPMDMAPHVRGEGHGCPFASLPVSP